ncbi:S41 family peptidase [Clostridium oryzae]|uniref:Peptidase family S41 n=1 Tax=Clostridium oryzae TaxID=1450648 RepID=A0A1V4IS71_9CLOT|nr:S41 family peptidase [Clostridium oryzae]OPJ62881.1 peptidase family S41 [Clostridium oryzae]
MRIFTKRKMEFMLAAIILLIVISGCNISNKQNSLSSRDKKWIEDIEYLNRALLKDHANLYHHIKKKDFDKEVFNLENDVPKLKNYQIKYRIAHMVASIGDAHTHLVMDTKIKRYPIGLSWFGNELRVVKINKKYKSILGKKLIAINGIKINKVIKKVNTLISHENSQWLKVNNVEYVTYYDVLKYLNITSNGTTDFSFDGNKITTITIKPSYSEDNMVQVENFMTHVPVEYQYKVKKLKPNPFWYEYIPTDKILYFQYNQCMDRKIAQKIVKLIGIRDSYKDYKSYPDFDKFTDKVMRTIEKKKIDKLIIDLRYNGGGSSLLMTKFANELRKKLHKSIQVFVIIGKQTFSSGVFAAIDLKRYTNAIILGEPTGGNVNGYGEVLIISLPNSKLSISYSTKYFDLTDRYKSNFIPDISIKQSYNDYKSGIDDAYEAVKEYKN